MAQLGIGNVDLELGDETVTLKPSLRAAQTLSRAAGGLSAAINKVAALDIDIITAVIAAGTGATTTKAIEAVGEKVFAAGPAAVVEPVVRFLVILANGGKPPVTEESSDTENPPGSQSQ